MDNARKLALAIWQSGLISHSDMDKLTAIIASHQRNTMEPDSKEEIDNIEMANEAERVRLLKPSEGAMRAAKSILWKMEYPNDSPLIETLATIIDREMNIPFGKAATEEVPPTCSNCYKRHNGGICK